MKEVPDFLESEVNLQSLKLRKVEIFLKKKKSKKIVDSVKIDAFKEKPLKRREEIRTVKSVKDRAETKTEAAKEKRRKTCKGPVKRKTAKESKYSKRNQSRKTSERETGKSSKAYRNHYRSGRDQRSEKRAHVFLRDVFASMNLGEVEITSEYNTTDGCLEVDFEGEDMGILIGKRGQTLDSLQYLTSLVVNKGKSNYIRVKLDTEDYRRRRKETLENLARGIAYKVKRTRRPVVLEPMNPYERRIIHSALQGNKFVETVQ